MLAITNRNLDQLNSIEWNEDACVGVVISSAGYPGSYKTGFPITGLDDLDMDDQNSLISELSEEIHSRLQTDIAYNLPIESSGLIFNMLV